MRTKFCTKACKDEKYKMHDAVCLYKKRDEEDIFKRLESLEKRVKELEDKPTNKWCNERPTC